MIDIKIGEGFGKLAQISMEAAQGKPGRYNGTDESGRPVVVEVSARQGADGNTWTTVKQTDLDLRAQSQNSFVIRGGTPASFYRDQMVRSGPITTYRSESDDSLDGTIDSVWSSKRDIANGEWEITVERRKPNSKDFFVVHESSNKA